MAHILSINQLVQLSLPVGFVVNPDYLQQELYKWQALLYESFDGKVPENRKYEIELYSEAQYQLFASLIVREILNKTLTSTFLSGLSNSGENSESTDAPGNVKHIKTGPTEVEYHNTIDSFAKLLAAANKDGGLFTLINQETCINANKVGVKLPWCISPKSLGVLEFFPGPKSCIPEIFIK